MRASVFAVCAVASLGLAAVAIAHETDPHRLPLGDGKISHEPKAGWIWACRIDPNGGGAQRDGPWIDHKSKTYDLTRKIAVSGSVTWPHSFTIKLDDDKRVFASNDLPDHPTGTFPIARSDPAYQYDANPNRIQAQKFSFALPANPKPLAQPTCAPNAIGILLTGVSLFNALDAPGRDAVAHETQDACRGHPQPAGAYHYHSLTNCLDDKRSENGHSQLAGYALDGFGIFGMYGEGGKQLSSDELDACHGHAHEIEWDGKRVVMYHYHATLDFPYTVGCMRGAFSFETMLAISGGPPRGRPGGPPPGGPPPR